MEKKNMRAFKDEFVKLYKEGYSLRKIGEMYGVSKITVKRYVEEECEIKPRGLTDTQKKKAVELYSNGHYSINQIAKTLNACATTVRRYLTSEFGKLNNSGEKKYEHLRSSIVKDYESGLSATELAEKYGVSRQTALDYTLESGVKIRNYSETSRLFPLREDYFDTLSEKKAYILGILFSEGRLDRHPGCNFIDFSVFRDRKYVMDIIVKELFIDEHPKIELFQNTYKLRISSSKLHDRLNSLGMYNNKEVCNDTELFEPSFKEFEKSFWEGFIFAGISINHRDLFISGHRCHMGALYSYISNELGIKCKLVQPTSIVIMNKKETKKLIKVYPFIQQFIEEHVKSFDSSVKHSWGAIINS